MLGLEAAKRKVKAYIRVQQPFYETSSKGSAETDDPKPAGTVGVWWHETLRGLAAIDECVTHPTDLLVKLTLDLVSTL